MSNLELIVFVVRDDIHSTLDHHYNAVFWHQCATRIEGLDVHMADLSHGWFGGRLSTSIGYRHVR